MWLEGDLDPTAGLCLLRHWSSVCCLTSSVRKEEGSSMFGMAAGCMNAVQLHMLLQSTVLEAWFVNCRTSFCEACESVAIKFTLFSHAVQHG